MCHTRDVATGMQLRRNPERRRRLSDAETEQRMLDAGTRLVGEQGLSLSLEHISMEELIADAGVSRTSSYRRWPTKDAFAADLLLHIAGQTQLSTDRAPYLDAIRNLPPELTEHLDTAQGRRDVAVEVMRTLAIADFSGSLASPSWRSFVVLRAAHGTLPAGELWDRLTEALTTSERRLSDFRADTLRTAAAAMGYRLVDPDAVDWTTTAELSSASFTGMLIRAFSDPDSVLAQRPLAPFGSSRQASWNLAALATASVFFAAAEPDPAVIWDADRVATMQAILASPDALLAIIWPDA